MTATAITLFHRDAAERLADAIERAGVPVPTLVQIDNAIISASDNWCDVNGIPHRASTPSFEYGSQRWDEIVVDVLASLELDYDEVFEVAP